VPYITLTYRQSASMMGTSIHVQTSTDMQNWSTVTPDFTQNMGTDANTGDPIIQVQVNSTGNSKEFIRLNVTQP